MTRHNRLRVLVAVPLAAAAFGTVSMPAPARTATGDGAWLLLESDRDGHGRLYSAAADGSRLSPVLPPELALGRDTDFNFTLVSPDGGTIAALRDRKLYLARADGAGVRALGRAWPDAFSRDGRLFAFDDRKGLWVLSAEPGEPTRIAPGASAVAGFSPDGRRIAFTYRSALWVAGTDGRGLRRLATGSIGVPTWSPTAAALAYLRVTDRRTLRAALVVQRLAGKPRVLAKTGPHEDEYDLEYYWLRWSADGTWLGYGLSEDLVSDQRDAGSWAVRPGGGGLHRASSGDCAWAPTGHWLACLSGSTLSAVQVGGGGRRVLSTKAWYLPVWSPDAKRLVFVASGRGALVVGDAAGNGLRELPVSARIGYAASPVWAPDSRLLAVEAGQPQQVWVLDSDGTDPRRVTSAGHNGLVGWSRLPPILPPAPPLAPTERVLGPDTVASDTPVMALAADGSRVAFAPAPARTDCERVDLWTPGEDTLARLASLPAPCAFGEGRLTELALAGSRAAWVADCFSVTTAGLAAPVPMPLTDNSGEADECTADAAFYRVRGDGEQLLFDDRSRLVRIGGGNRRCQANADSPRLCTVLRSGLRAARLDFVSSGLIALRERGRVTTLDAGGAVRRVFSFTPADVYAARLDGEQLVVARSYTVESYSIATGALQFSRPLPTGDQLIDADGGIAVLRHDDTIVLLRLSDGRSTSLAPGRAPRFADLESPGLFYSYTTPENGGRVAFLPRAELDRRLEEGS